MEPLVSVIIPTYNRADYLKLALKSVLEQTYKNIEVIVADDGSTDNTAEVVADFNDPRIKHFYKKNTGLPAATRNLGLREASGEYIAFLDSDDLWHPRKLKIQVEYLRKHPEYYLVYSNAWYIDENGARGGLIYNPDSLNSLKEGEVFEELVKSNFIPLLTVLMKREVFEKIGFFNDDPSIRAGEDYEYWLRVALRYKIGFVKEPLAMYRVHSGRLSREMISDSGKRHQKILSSFINNPLVTNKNKIVKKIYMSCYRFYYTSARLNWENSDKSAAKEDLKKYLNYSLRHLHITHILRALFLWVLLKFDYDSLKKVSDKIKKCQE